MNEPVQVLIVDDRPEADTARVALESAGFLVRIARGDSEVFQHLQENPPACLLVAARFSALAGNSLLQEVKDDNLCGHLPAVLLVDAERVEQGVDWTDLPADDYLAEPFTSTELLTRVRLCLARAQRDINANPLTGLPGNVSIMREVERRLALERPFALAYLDIDHFKPFNDKYGFTRGDEVLRMTARIIHNAVRALNDPDSYVGHIGGDDFILLVPPRAVEPICKEVLRNFDLIVPNFYDDEDRERGCIDSVDRQGNTRSFPLMSCSIAVVDTAHVHAGRYAEISARAAAVKHYAKGLPGSNYLIDRRR